jgi:hypothetical protein
MQRVDFLRGASSVVYCTWLPLAGTVQYMAHPLCGGTSCRDADKMKRLDTALSKDDGA